MESIKIKIIGIALFKLNSRFKPLIRIFKFIELVQPANILIYILY